VRLVQRQGARQGLGRRERRWVLPITVGTLALALAVLLGGSRSGGFLGWGASLTLSSDRFLDLVPSALAAGHGRGLGHANANGNGNGNGEGGNGNGNGNGDGGNGNGNGNGDGGGNAKPSHHSHVAAQEDTSDESSDDGASSAAADSPAAAADAPIGTRPSPESGAIQAGGPHDSALQELVVVADNPGIAARARGLGFRVIEETPLAALDFSLLRLRPPARMPPVHALALLRQALPGLTADVNTLYQPYEVQGLQSSSQFVSLPARDYARRMIDWPESAGCGAGLRIGMIDTAVEAESPVLAGQRLHQRSFVAGASDERAHGTAIASLLVGRGKGLQAQWNGLLPSADLYLADVFAQEGGSSEASAASLAAALDWMVANHVPVVNVSVSGNANALLALAVRRATERGTVLVAAAGNGGPLAPPAYPAAYPQVIAVTAVDHEGNVFEGANRGDYIAFAAPGVRIWIPGRDASGRLETGTSFAAPYVAAAATLAVRGSGAEAAAGVLRQLAAHTRHLGPPGKNPIYGYGLPKVAARCATPTAAAP
jgi:hypothetical protein